MTWSCVKCGSPNPKTEQLCHKCGARWPFLPPSDESENTEAPESFRVPRKGELTALLHHGIEQLRAGNLSIPEFQERVETALGNVPLVFSTIIDGIQESSEEMPGYGDGVIASLTDCQTLFESGLTELLHFSEDEDDFHLRFGWLLLEKGEQEYVEILQALRRDSANQAFEGADNVLGRLYQSVSSGELEEEEYLDQLASFEANSQKTLKEIGKTLSQGIKLASEKEEDSFDQAHQEMEKAARLMGQLLLNLYASDG